MINDLRDLIDTRLNTIKSEYGIADIGYRLASDQKVFPHVVWDITLISPTDMGRNDLYIDFHVWAKSESSAFSIMEAIRKLFQFLNAPDSATQILPTFYDMSSGTIDDPDKTLIHGVVRMQCQVYESGVTDAGLLREEQTNGINN